MLLIDKFFIILILVQALLEPSKRIRCIAQEYEE